MSLIKINPKAVIPRLGAVRGQARMSELLGDERGLSTVEYVILLALIAGIAIVTWSQFGSSVHGALGKAKTTFEDNVPH